MPIIDLSNNNKLIAHAEREMVLAGISTPDNPESARLANYALSIIRIISSQQHTGRTVQLTLQLVNALASFQLLSPLTANPIEWHDEREGKRINKRMPSVFMDKDGNVWNSAAIAWDVEGKHIFTGDLPGEYTSTQPLMLPCYPKMIKIVINEDSSLKRPEDYEEAVAFFRGEPKAE